MRASVRITFRSSPSQGSEQVGKGVQYGVADIRHSHRGQDGNHRRAEQGHALLPRLGQQQREVRIDGWRGLDTSFKSLPQPLPVDELSPDRMPKVRELSLVKDAHFQRPWFTRDRRISPGGPEQFASQCVSRLWGRPTFNNRQDVDIAAGSKTSRARRSIEVDRDQISSENGVQNALRFYCLGGNLQLCPQPLSSARTRGASRKSGQRSLAGKRDALHAVASKVGVPDPVSKALARVDGQAWWRGPWRGRS